MNDESKMGLLATMVYCHYSTEDYDGLVNVSSEVLQKFWGISPQELEEFINTYHEDVVEVVDIINRVIFSLVERIVDRESEGG